MVHYSVSEEFRADAAPLAGRALASTMAAPCTPPPRPASAAQERSGVVVLGMHRSGTSAVTRALNPSA